MRGSPLAGPPRGYISAVVCRRAAISTSEAPPTTSRTATLSAASSASLARDVACHVAAGGCASADGCPFCRRLRLAPRWLRLRLVRDEEDRRRPRAFGRRSFVLLVLLRLLPETSHGRWPWPRPAGRPRELLQGSSHGLRRDQEAAAAWPRRHAGPRGGSAGAPGRVEGSVGVDQAGLG